VFILSSAPACRQARPTERVILRVLLIYQRSAPPERIFICRIKSTNVPLPWSGQMIESVRVAYLSPVWSDNSSI